MSSFHLADHTYSRVGADLSELQSSSLSNDPTDSGSPDKGDRYSTSSDVALASNTAESRIADLEAKLEAMSKENAVLVSENRELKGNFGLLFTEDQVHAIQRGGEMRGIPWSTETIKKGLQIRFACGTAGYNLLRSQHQPLPGIRTLQRQMAKFNFEPGVLHQVVEALSAKVTCMEEEEKFCCITLDEMSISSAIEYDSSIGQIIGNVNLPHHAGQATHGLVFMLAGISSRWKQIVAYYLTGNKTDGKVFQQIILEIIEKAASVGLHVSAVTSDMGSCNRAMWSTFGLATNRYVNVTHIQHPLDQAKNLYFIADVPHVIKNLRTSFVNGNELELPENIVSSHNLSSNRVSLLPVKDLIEFQEHLDIKLAPNLTKATIEPSHFQKMKVSSAMHLFSNSVSSGIRF